MDDKNLCDSLRIFSSDPDGKIKKLMNFTSRGGEVSDPWYTDRFDVTYKDVCDGCEALLKTLENE